MSRAPYYAVNTSTVFVFDAKKRIFGVGADSVRFLRFCDRFAYVCQMQYKSLWCFKHNRTFRVTRPSCNLHFACAVLRLTAHAHANCNNIDPKNMADYLLSVHLCDESDRVYLDVMHLVVHVSNSYANGRFCTIEWRNWLLMISCNKKITSEPDIIHSMNCHRVCCGTSSASESRNPSSCRIINKM